MNPSHHGSDEQMFGPKQQVLHRGLCNDESRCSSVGFVDAEWGSSSRIAVDGFLRPCGNRILATFLNPTHPRRPRHSGRNPVVMLDFALTPC